MPDAVEFVAIAIEPAERAERARAPEQAEGMCQRLVGQRLRERPEQHDAGEVVVGERRMAHVRGEQELGVARAGEVDLARRQRAVLERRVDDDVVVAVLERLELPPAHAEPPLLLPVRRPVGDQLGVVRVREDVIAELAEADDGIDRDAVAEHVERRVRRVDDARAVGRLDPGAAEIPLPGDRPIEDLRPGRSLDHFERDLAPEHRERLAHAVAREAPRDREQLSHEGEEFLADVALRRGRCSSRSASRLD